ncbi:hypothetical protein B0S90_2124 [Caldicellulosiruptor bescii]|uniref:Uncharacterized protein n=2 Tax=Caldicellulosiruptor bescii TaxID=31899 RepID=B9MKQ2_CALBD|nr:hypothetical protein Athe_1817 [Caldicellulosiruptor bescii DSM 6725]PBC89272.1 hypothetical protein B0S87_2363 [Caldicellulosiruptor bescii]PBC91243.1 hypothetical protein B0S89_1625 [Caldicellulosiruptor bescii]PBD03343.1 hypothetical protein B0S85_0941 [Caldicellulosiruptor bescii]PBD07042.1 hypothetical protein B0S90_2124 [Caldicellulosiruptor bescii]
MPRPLFLDIDLQNKIWGFCRYDYIKIFVKKQYCLVININLCYNILGFVKKQSRKSSVEGIKGLLIIRLEEKPN